MFAARGDGEFRSCKSDPRDLTSSHIKQQNTQVTDVHRQSAWLSVGSCLLPRTQATLFSLPGDGKDPEMAVRKSGQTSCTM